MVEAAGVSVLRLRYEYIGQLDPIARKILADRLPRGVKPQMAPISSIMGQVLQVGMYSEGNQTDPIEVRTLADWVVRQRVPVQDSLSPFQCPSCDLGDTG